MSSVIARLAVDLISLDKGVLAVALVATLGVSRVAVVVMDFAVLVALFLSLELVEFVADGIGPRWKA